MEIIYINDLTIIENETAATVGFFDGVHKGHRYLIEQLKKKAGLLGLPTSVITFSAHPKKVLQSEYPLQLLNSFDERMRHLVSTGIDYCYVIHFTKKISEITAENFIRQILHKQLKIKFLLIGYDHKFGKGRNREFKDYVEFGKACGITVDKAEELPDNSVSSFSSTSIRRFLQEGNVQKATAMLSYRYILEGNVVSGNRLGRTIGFPTANIELVEKEKLIPPKGVYACIVNIDGEKYYGMIYIGRRPTVSTQGEKRIEVHIFDFEKDIYGEKIQIELMDFLRPDVSFPSLEDLRKQLEKDKENAHNSLKNQDQYS
jgi:riboflavin kinase/FMN adenylyltransferase